ncbi:hypothetical protein EQP59_04915 [Ornithobacterium rhinotracheale]|uniref:Cytochrome c domain-containing protein n=1 Tax=Ornithobacterium rhinotracheale TaxID=28251 RepID=A0A3R5UXH3_ORNRH|nr:c-type cytochrome [Ornithobacterium rhinotracheale]QAR30725.1 hypothetical protein EQP59_04915 [Ornithobacterium rhinotracheale]
MIKKIIPFVFAGISIVSCAKKENPQATNNEPTPTPKMPGEKYVRTQCYVCHHPTAPEENRAAPTLYEIKQVYLKSGASQEEFIKEFSDFTQRPTQEAAKMKEAVKKYGLMPNNGFSREDIEAIAKYVYENDLPKPDWYQADK